MGKTKNPSREAVRRYCIVHNLFTGGTNDQYERMFDMLDRQMPIHDIATVIWVCSPDAGKHAAEIESDLRNMIREERSDDDADNESIVTAS